MRRGQRRRHCVDQRNRRLGPRRGLRQAEIVSKRREANHRNQHLDLRQPQRAQEAAPKIAMAMAARLIVSAL